MKFLSSGEYKKLIDEIKELKKKNGELEVSLKRKDADNASAVDGFKKEIESLRSKVASLEEDIRNKDNLLNSCASDSEELPKINEQFSQFKSKCLESKTGIQKFRRFVIPYVFKFFFYAGKDLSGFRRTIQINPFYRRNFKRDSVYYRPD
jgi:Microtubule associated protein (MAP65/ASE1 family).